MTFTPIDLETWPRAQMFRYFSRMAPTGYSLTVPVDVTGLRAALKARGLKFFPTYLWLVTKCLSEQPEFTTAVRDGVLGTYDSLTPLYAAFHEDDHTFSLMWTEFDEDLEVFHRRYLDDKARWGFGHGFYIVWPFIGPSSVRETFGRAGDYFLYPAFWASYAIHPWYVPTGIQTGFFFNDLDDVLPTYFDLKKAAVDPYIMMREAWVKHRAVQVAR